MMDAVPEVLIVSAIGKWQGSVFRLSLSEWEKCLKEADYHGLTPLLYHSITNTTWFENIPEAISDRLRKSYDRAAVLGIRSEVDEFLYLCNHLDMHGYLNRIVRTSDDPAWVRSFICHRDSENRLIWFSDLYRFLLQYEEILSPDLLEERANEWGITEALKNCFIILDRIDTECLPEILRLIDIIRYIFPSRSYLKRCYPRLSMVWPLTIFLHLGMLIIRHTEEAFSLLLEMKGPLQGTRLTDRT